MKIHEYQAKALLAGCGIPTPRGGMAESVEGALAMYVSLLSPLCVVKAQIHAGGRGKSGGVRLCRSAEEILAASGAMLGMRLVTPQTGPEGTLVRKVLVENGTDIARGLYVAVVLDRTVGRLAVMVSPDVSMDIEAVAPERVLVERLDASHHMWPFQARRLLMGCGLEGPLLVQGTTLLQRMVRLAVEKDATLVEINPLAITTSGNFVALDARMEFDDSALFRHMDIKNLMDYEENDPLEQEAVNKGLNYVRLQGSVGTLVNGAGLTMATMDAVRQAGAEPANFLDVGGNASEDTVAEGLRLLLRDPQVRGVLINIFGGILRCDVVARGVVNALISEKERNIPLVVRLEGTNVEEGRRILRESGLHILMAQGLGEAVQSITTLVRSATGESA